MLRDRARSAAILVPPLLLAVWLGGPWITLVVGLAVVVASIEAFRLLTAAGLHSLPLLGVLLAVVVALGDSVTTVPGGSGLLLASLGIVLVGHGGADSPGSAGGPGDLRDDDVRGAVRRHARLRARGSPRRIRTSIPRAILGFLGPERAWILVLVLVVWAFDTAAYFTGRRFGRRPFMHHISPAKTLEGVGGGVVAAAIVGAVLVASLGRPWPAGLLLGIALATAAQAGDLAESMLKRAAAAKESGTLIPGHGGMLDRVDSFLFAAPVAYFYVVSILH